MRAQFARGRMVGKHGYRHRFVPVFYRFPNGFNGTLVQIFDGFQLQVYIALVSCLIACFDVQVNEIIGLQGIDGGLCLAFVIGGIKSRSTFHIDAPESGIASDAPDEVDRRNHRALADGGVFIRQRLHLRTIARAPGPDAVRRVFALAHPFQVKRMRSQQVLRSHNQPVQQIGGFLRFGNQRLHQIRTEGLQRDIVRRHASHVFVSAFHHQQMPVLHAGIEMDTVGA